MPLVLFANKCAGNDLPIIVLPLVSLCRCLGNVFPSFVVDCCVFTRPPASVAASRFALQYVLSGPLALAPPPPKSCRAFLKALSAPSLLPMSPLCRPGTAARQITVVDHVAPELQKINGLSEFKSDLPCVTSGTCPVPSFRCSKYVKKHRRSLSADAG